MKVADYNNWCLLLGVVNENGILCCYCVDHAVGQSKGGSRSQCVAFGRLW